MPWLMATPLDDPAGVHAPIDRPICLTVAATDGSQICPYRHMELLVCLFNISEIAFQYGTLEKPIMNSQTHVGPVANYEVLAAAEGSRSSTDIVAAYRKQLELEVLDNLALRVRVAHRKIVCMADGTLIWWMLQRIDPEPVKAQPIACYAAQLMRFRTHDIPVCSVISMPNSTEVMNLLHGLRENTGNDRRGRGRTGGAAELRV